MSLATIIAILGAVSTLLSIAKDAPDVLAEARALLAKVEPHVQEAGIGAATWFAQLKAEAG